MILKIGQNFTGKCVAQVSVPSYYFRCTCVRMFTSNPVPKIVTLYGHLRDTFAGKISTTFP